MKYKLFGHSGLRVSEFCLGTMTFGEEWQWGASKEVSKKIFDIFTGAGGNFIDTANRYTEGTSEKFVGEFTASERERFVVATKYTLHTPAGDPNSGGNHRKNMIQSLNASLKRLNMDYVDILWLHAWDYTTHEEEVMRGLDDLVSAGKVFYIGISDTPAWIVSRANTIAELRGWTRFSGLQVEYSLIQRAPERELLPMAESLDLAITTWGTIGGGLLTGKYDKNKLETNYKERRLSTSSPRLKDINFKIADEVKKIAAETGYTPSQIAINWARQKKGNIIPIIGSRKEEQIKDNLNSLNFELSEEFMKRLDDVSKIELGFPHEFLSSDNMREVIFAGTYSKIVNHHKK